MEATVKKTKKTADRQNGVLTARQIRNRVGDGWAIIENAEFNGCIFLRGKLLYHSSDKQQAHEEMRRRTEKDLFFKYCGKRDPNVAYLLNIW